MKRCKGSRILFVLALLGSASCGSSGDGGLPDGAPGVLPNAPPATEALTVLDMQPRVVDADGGDALVLTGRGFVEPVTLSLRDVQGESVGPAIPARVRQDGTRVETTLPSLAASGARRELRVHLRNGDGREADIEASLVVERAFRSIDGTGNHENQTLRGSAGIALRRTAPAAYADGVSALAGSERPNPRVVSNALCAQTTSIQNAAGASDHLWQWGQFLDHDIDLTPEADPLEPAPIAVPIGDPDFDPLGTGVVRIFLNRSAYAEGSTPRQQVNEITAFVDASNVYGSDAVRAAALRSLDGTGRLRTSAGDLLPFNEAGLPNAGGTDAALFLAGDVRANEQVGLTAMHTLFVREHNRLADAIRARQPDLSDDDIYHEARRLVAAEVQVISYREFLPLLLGADALSPYRGYDDQVDPGIANEFSTAAYRLGHSLLSGTLLRVDAAGNEIPDGHLALRDAYFNPARIVDEGGIEPVLRGLARQQAQALDLQVVDDVRNFLFGPPGAGGLDLAALNVQRGRDHGLASYNDAREAYGLARRGGFDEVSSDRGTRERLAALYATVDDVDLWIGGLAEDHVPGAMVGELFRALLADQFERLRDGDRFWYAAIFTGDELRQVEQTRLSDVIRRNTSIGAELPDDVFRVGAGAGPPVQAATAQPLDDTRRERMRDWRGVGPAPRRR